MKFLTFASRRSLLTVELISQPSNLIKRCRAEMARRQERAAFLHPRPSLSVGPRTETGVGAAASLQPDGLFANPVLRLPLGHASMPAIHFAFYNSWR